MPVPKSWPKWKVRDLERGVVFWHYKKPGVSNLVKFAEDCLNGLVWKDEAQIAWVKNPQKYYGFEPKTVIEVEELA